MLRIIQLTRPAIALAALLSVQPANAESASFQAILSGAEEVPPAKAKGTGSADMYFDTETKTCRGKVPMRGRQVP